MSSADVRPLAVWPHTVTAAQRDLVGKAKQEVGVPYKVMLSPAVPGSPGRVLAFGSVPPFYCESVLIAPENVDRYESILGAVRFLLTAPRDTPGSISEAMWLSHAMGCDIHLLNEEFYDGPQ